MSYQVKWKGDRVMNKININVRVTYRVSLQDVEVTDDVAIALAHYEGETS